MAHWLISIEVYLSLLLYCSILREVFMGHDHCHTNWKHYFSTEANQVFQNLSQHKGRLKVRLAPVCGLKCVPSLCQFCAIPESDPRNWLHDISSRYNSYNCICPLYLNKPEILKKKKKKKKIHFFPFAQHDLFFYN